MTPTGDMLGMLGMPDKGPDPAVITAPIRTCIGCRVRAAQARLLRFGRRSDGQIVPALVTRENLGRRAYLCPRRACLDQAIKRRAFARAFSTARRSVSVVSLDTKGEKGENGADSLWAATSEQLRREISLLTRTSENPHAHLRLRGLQQLLFELSSPLPTTSRSSSRQGRSAAPRAPDRSATTSDNKPGPMHSHEIVTSAQVEITRKGGASSHE